jgi:small subunit ribosomal protein S9
MPTKTTTTKKTKPKMTKEKTAEVSVAKKAKKIEEPKKAPKAEVVEVAEISAETDAKANGGVEKYYESVGRRKEATARVRVYTKKSTDENTGEEKALITVNDKPYFEYFRTVRLQNIVEAPLRKLKSLTRFKATVKVLGGGIAGQADAIKFGLSRALILFDPNFAKKLKKAGFLTRDAREKERRKYGLKKARKAPQWAKR